MAPSSAVAQAGNAPGATVGDGRASVPADLAFDVVSIRPGDAGSRRRHLQVAPGGDRYEAIGAPIGWTILMAYFPFRMHSRDRILGAPDWVWNDSYDVVAKVGDADLPAWHKFTQHLFVQNPMLEIMLQNALAERCKMVVHRVPARVDGYALVVGGHGPNRKNLVESKPEDTIPERAGGIAFDGRMVPIYPHELPVLRYDQTSMAALALQLSGEEPVVDRTGLPGKYRFDLTRLGTDGLPASDWDLAPLGLRLIPTKVPTENIVIDHIDRPSPN